MSVNRESTLRASRKGRTAIAVGALLSLGLAACTTDANDAITTTTAAPAGASTTTTETVIGPTTRTYGADTSSSYKGDFAVSIIV